MHVQLKLYMIGLWMFVKGDAFMRLGYEIFFKKNILKQHSTCETDFITVTDALIFITIIYTVLDTCIVMHMVFTLLKDAWF